MGEKTDLSGQEPASELTRSARRSLLLHRQIAQDLSDEALEQWAPRILNNIEQTSRELRGEPHIGNLRRWLRLVEDRDLPGLRLILTGVDEDAIQMREVSPLRGLLSHVERDEALRSARIECASP